MAETDLHISERLRKLLPPLTADERKQLKENILDDGQVLDPILWWFDGTKKVVIDGMHRWEIIRGIDGQVQYRTQPMNFVDYEDAEIWILNHQLGRRNLLRPIDIKRVVGELYNRLKGKQGGDHKSSESKRQNDDLIGKTSEKLGEKSGLSPRKVERSGARVESEAKLTKAAKIVADKATDAEVKALSQLEVSDQDQVARLVRTGKAKSVKEGLKGFKPPTAEKKPDKPPKQYDRSFWYKQWNTSIGPLVRLVDKIARELNEMHGARHKGVKEGLDLATRNMIEWMGVKK